MKLNYCGLPRHWSWALGGLLFVAAPGCEQQPVVDRAAYVADDEMSDESSDQETMPRGVVRKLGPASSPTKKKKRTMEAKVVDAPSEPPLSQPIATPFPGQIISTTEAERESQPVAFEGRTASDASPPPTAAPPSSFDLHAALRQVDERNRRGAAAAAKGAWFTARAEFADSLDQLAASLDAGENGTRRMAALAAGLTALTEAEAFTGRGTVTQADVAAVTATHKTAPFVAPLVQGQTSATLHEAYVCFAIERLSESVAGCDSGSVALHGLGKVHGAADSAVADARAKTRAFYEAALTVGPANILAANDLAVLMAEEGRFEQARELLHESLRRSPQPALWQNLAAVNDRLGRGDLAHLARLELAALERRSAAAPGTVIPAHNVAWLDPRSFATTSRTGSELVPPTPQPAVVASRPTAAPAAAKPTPGVAQRPVSRVLAY